MGWSEKIDNRKYLFGSSVGLLAACFAAKWEMHGTILLSAIVIGSALNQWLMFLILGRALGRMTQEGGNEGRNAFVFALQIVGKFAVLGVPFYVLIQQARHLVLFGLVLFTFQLIILVLSIRNRGTFSK